MLKPWFRAAGVLALSTAVALPLEAQQLRGHGEGQRPGAGACMPRAGMLERLTATLALTAEQVEAVRPIVAGITEKRRALLEQHRGDPDAMHGVMLALHATLEEKLGPVLTPGQMEQFRAHHERMQQRERMHEDGCRGGL